MKVTYEYTVLVTVNEDEGAEVEKQLLAKAKEFDPVNASVSETDAIELEEDEESE